MSGEEIHVFQVFGVNLAYSRETGALFTVDDVAKEIIQKGITPEVVAKFGEKAVRETEEEIKGVLKSSTPSSDEAREDPCEPQIPLKAVCLNVAHDCNLYCKYCFAAQGRFGGKPELMSKEVARKTVDFLIKSSGKRRFLDLDFFGGEPLLAFDVVRDTVEYGRRKGKEYGKEFRFTLTTNCTLMTDEIATYLADEGISLILSIDGRPETHDRMRVFRGGQPSHSLVLSNALKAVARRNGQNYWVRGTYTRFNLDFAEDVKYLYNAGFRYISLEPAVGEGDWSITPGDLPAIEKSYQDLAAFWEERYRAGDPFYFYHFNLGLQRGMCIERRETGCGAGYEYVTVTPSGEIFACHQLVGKEEYKLGDVNVGIENQRIPALFRRARVPHKDSCVDCWAKYLCGGGCHARAIEATGDVMKPDPFTCELLRKRMEYALYVEYVSAKG